jgi:hypothetical protein
MEENVLSRDNGIFYYSMIFIISHTSDLVIMQNLYVMKHGIFWDVTRCGLVRTDVLEERSTSITLMMEALHSSETSVLIRATLHNITEDAIIHSHCHENLKSSLCMSNICHVWMKL